MTNKKKIYDVLIIGAGPAGMSAALYASRANLSVLMLDKGAPGGQLLNTDTIENYVGGIDIDANKLAMEMFEDALKFGAEYTYGDVQSIKKENNLFRTISSTDTHESKTVIIATGTEYRKLNVPGEEELNGRGVSYCATCDGAFFNNKNIAVVGGGDSALEAALYLTQYGEVSLIHRRNEYRAEPYLQDLVANNNKITERFNFEIDEILGDDKVKEVKLKHKGIYGDYSLLVDGVFINVGQLPNTRFMEQELLTEEGWVITDKETLQTSIQGLYAIGDVLDKPVRQVANAVGEGSEVIHYLLSYIQSL